MFPNLRAELARNKITMKELHRRLSESGKEIAISTLSQKINGHYEFTLDEAEAVRAVIDTKLSLDELFERE